MGKALTYDQIAGRQAQAVNFLRNVTGDDERADEIESMSVEEYGAERGFALANPTPNTLPVTSVIPVRREKTMAKKTIAELEQENEQLQSELEEAENLIGDIWEELLDLDEDSSQDDLAEGALNVSTMINEFDPDSYPWDEDGEIESSSL